VQQVYLPHIIRKTSRASSPAAPQELGWKVRLQKQKPLQTREAAAAAKATAAKAAHQADIPSWKPAESLFLQGSTSCAMYY
jgi:hypothetical protein